jgi:tripartite-type tricarboxylate transporter receptor subunit TctC
MAAPLSRRELLRGGSACAALIAPSLAHAADFYQGKTLTMIVGFAPGGGVDTTSRLIARHLPRLIPGQPAIVVQNMEGAGGMIAANFLDRRVAPDGLTIATPGRSWFVEGVAKNPSLSADPTKVSWIGSPGAVNSNVYVRAATGIKTFDDFKASPRPITFGALGSTTTTALIPVMFAAAGLPVKVVSGYGATARILLALEQGEVDAVFTVEDSFAHRVQLIRDKVVIPIMRSLPGTPALPLVRDALPKSDGPVLALVLAIDSFGLPVVGPPGIPAERLEILRAAFLAMCQDKDYQAEALKMGQYIGTPLSGAQLQVLIDELAVAATPAAVAAYRRLGGPR